MNEDLRSENTIDLLKYYTVSMLKAGYLRAKEKGVAETPYWQSIHKKYLEG